MTLWSRNDGLVVWLRVGTGVVIFLCGVALFVAARYLFATAEDTDWTEFIFILAIRLTGVLIMAGGGSLVGHDLVHVPEWLSWTGIGVCAAGAVGFWIALGVTAKDADAHPHWDRYFLVSAGFGVIGLCIYAAAFDRH